MISIVGLGKVPFLPTATQPMKQLDPFIREYGEPRQEPSSFWNQIGPDHGNPIASCSSPSL